MERIEKRGLGRANWICRCVIGAIGGDIAGSRFVLDG